MLESMTDVLATTVYDDRLAQAESNRRLIEAQQAAQGRRARGQRSYREAVAGMLTALAARLAPNVTVTGVATAR
jgi:hypothetical protein